MISEKQSVLVKEKVEIDSITLGRKVVADCFFPAFLNRKAGVNLLLINDGQSMEELGLATMLEELFAANEITSLICVGIHAGDRMNEYGTACCLDYKGRGNKAAAYSSFILEELLPFLKTFYDINTFREKAIAGFSLGGLSALDIVWNYPAEFTKAGVFSGSLWWRTKEVGEGYNEDTDRIMHAQVRNGNYAPGLKFFFQTGTLDETADRNNNGIIDSIDDTFGLIDELTKKGYQRQLDIAYLELQDGRHDTATWARAMPDFLKWGWGL